MSHPDTPDFITPGQVERCFLTAGAVSTLYIRCGMKGGRFTFT